MPVALLNEMTPVQMEAGYLEYRRMCYKLLLQDAREQRLVDVLSEPRTFAELVTNWSRGGDSATLQRLLAALVSYAAMVTDNTGGVTRYKSVEGFQDTPIDRDLMVTAVGAGQADKLLHANSYANLVKVARDGNNVVQSDFTAANSQMWDEFLSLPFYEYFRKSAVEALAAACRPGGMLLDAACGLGYGIAELRERLDVEARIVGVDISHDFIAMAIDRTRDLDVALARLDLQRELPILASNTFDGAMIIGAWHFLANPDEVLAELARLLRPGGVLAIGYYYTTDETFDRPIMDLRLRLREPVARATEAAALAAKAAELGLAVEQDFRIGCFGFTSFRMAE